MVLDLLMVVYIKRALERPVDLHNKPKRVRAHYFLMRRDRAEYFWDLLRQWIFTEVNGKLEYTTVVGDQRVTLVVERVKSGKKFVLLKLKAINEKL